MKIPCCKFNLLFAAAALVLLGTSALQAQVGLQLDLLGKDQTAKQAEYDALKQQIDAQMQQAYDALKGADKGKEDKGKGLQSAAKVLQGIAQMLEKVAPEAAKALQAIASIMQEMGQQDQNQADQAKPPMNQGQQASVDPALQQKLADLGAEIETIKAKIAALSQGSGSGTSSDTGSDQASLDAALASVYQFIYGDEWRKALGLDSVAAETNEEIDTIEDNVGELDTSRSAIRDYQANTRDSIDGMIERINTD